jgi:hypothetical protein
VRRCVWSRNLVDEEAIVRAGQECQRKLSNNYYYLSKTKLFSGVLSNSSGRIVCLGVQEGDRRLSRDVSI